MMKAVVTGGAGFIGSCVARELIRRGYEVTILDNLLTGSAGEIPQGSRFVQGDIRHHPFPSSVFRGVSYVFHLAAISRVSKSAEFPILTLDTNVEGTRNVLEASKAAGVKKVIFASSSSVYGDGNCGRRAQTEDATISPVSLYAQSKIQGEELCRGYDNVVCLRYFNVYGLPKHCKDITSSNTLVIPKFITAALNGSPLIIYGDGTQRRDFVYIDDIVNVTISAAEKDMLGVYNVGSGRSTSISTLARLVIKLTRSGSSISYENRKQGDPYFTRADMTKLKSAGFTHMCALESGVRKMIKIMMTMKLENVR